jgi:hypothetical protein
MKAKLAAFLTLTLACCLLVSTARAQATRIEFGGTGGPTGLLDPGTLRITPSGQVFVRGMVQPTLYEFDAPELGIADIIITINFNLQPPDMTGHSWGTFSMRTQDGSLFEGTWAGQRERVAEDHWISTLRDVGRCISGPLAGAQFRAVERIHTFAPLPMDWFSEVEGYLLIPGED